MTEKQENIVNSALRLFATQGYTSTSTSKVAKEAGVSEGLIFRHFGNKEGLLNAIMAMASEHMQRNIGAVMMISDPKEMLSKLFDMLFSVQESEQELWKLMYALKWHPVYITHCRGRVTWLAPLSFAGHPPKKISGSLTCSPMFLMMRMIKNHV